MEDFDWYLDDECDGDMTAEEPFEDGGDPETEFEKLAEEIYRFPKTTAGAVSLYRYLKNYQFEDGWRYLWTEFDDVMSTQFRMLVGLHIATNFTDRFSFPGFYSWLRTLDEECIGIEEDQNGILQLRDVLSRDLRNGSLGAADDAEILCLASSLDERIRKLSRRETNLVAVCWMKANLSGRASVHMSPSVSFISKHTLLREYKVIPQFEKIVLRDISTMDYIDILRLALQKMYIRPINLNHTHLTTLFAAEVPNCVAESKQYGSIVQWVLVDYLQRMMKGMRSEHAFALCKKDICDDDEFTEDEMQKIIREVFVWNKVSFYQAVATVYKELAHE